MFAQVAVPLRLPSLTYRVPEHLTLKSGDPVTVFVRKKKTNGIVLSLSENAPDQNKYEIKTIEGHSMGFPQISPHTIAYLQWISEYYLCPIGEVLRTFLPPTEAPPRKEAFEITKLGGEQGIEKLRGENQKKIMRIAQNTKTHFFIDPPLLKTARTLTERGWIKSIFLIDDTVEINKSPERGPNLNQDQAQALSTIRNAIRSHKFEPFLLEGVTGSGKTEIYLNAADEAIQMGKSVLVVVPEIALTPQLLKRFQSRLTAPIAILHSGISDGERSRQWHLLNSGAYRVCIGARSASLAPMQNLGLIIVDEEHDGALKQEDHLRYNARDLCLIRAKLSGCPAILGSATPSLETFFNARSGKFKHLLLPQRASGQVLPEIKIIDQTKQPKEKIISPPLKNAILQVLQKNRQVMLLLNRRGFSSFLLCGDCGHVPGCPNCSVSLTSYKKSGALKCHYCGYKEPAPTSCKSCGSSKLTDGTEGTEALEEEVKKDFSATVLRIDRESMERKGALEAALAKIASGAAQIIIGTQIIAKGHDFPNIALVGVINADTAFHLPDFRATERSFQLFTQMAGRAGRGGTPGIVYIQTHDPKHPSIVHATTHNYRGFAEQELSLRKQFFYPPFHRLARIVIASSDALLTERAAESAFQLLYQISNPLPITIVGPSPAVLSKIQGRYRWNLLLKSETPIALHTALKTFLENLPGKIHKKVSVQVDVDPNSLM